MPPRLLCALLWVLVAQGSAQARPLAPEAVPEELKPWMPWALHGLEDLGCPFLYNRSETRRCAWPTALALTLDRGSDSFEQSWTVYRETSGGLPGDARHWPEGVTVDGRPARVAERDGKPFEQYAAWRQSKRTED